MRYYPCILLAALLATASGARAQDVTATLAVSREATLYVTPSDKKTLAVSREATLYVTGHDTKTTAISREASLYIPPNALASLAVSREASMFNGFSFRNTMAALRIAAGLSTATPADVQRYNLVTTGNSANVVDLLDAVAVAYIAAHPPVP